ncbi:TIGR04283 family arsenosugar biosynthesis glycosyltransferase [Leeuwenhoekiella polynyae]|uniref:RSAM/selenodomain-associated transferase 2 n=1 Tax=Leeuwenhoekiella polynyae TaxID=1550906 RepID=A0A4Q0P0I9_9FLAO|nr:TIGR04283 family arsenosugar biosynthesis glycosyltransferase [Leeuwenhoekiella polynyae]RXG20010.1 rSAM/selenodomain-associated transferase 2 [Leeuwenhoekiella polynyae]
MISIVIPVLNEAENLPFLLKHLADHAADTNSLEIIVVDGGSTDETLSVAKQIQAKNTLKIQVVSSERGRAKQMNTGADNANGSVLYFLHADSFPPKDFDKHIANEVAKGDPAGCFKMRFDSNHWWLRLASYLTKFSWRACRGGDQSQFITRELFDEIGGFNESYVIYEDNILINELYARNSFVVIQHPIKSSARMYDKYGVWYVQYHFWTIYVKKWFGASAEELLAYYSKHLKK